MRRGLGGWVCSGLLAVVACDGTPAGDTLEAVHRFGEPGAPERHAFIGHERRTVVADHPSEAHRLPPGLRRTGRGRRSLSERFADVERVIVEATYADRGRSRRLPPRIQPVLASPRDGRPQVGISLAPELPGGLPLEGVRVTAVPEPDDLTLRTGEARVPEGARLEVAFGVLPLARAQGPVAFTLEVCEGGSCEPVLQERLSGDAASRWQDRRISLDAWAGRRVALRLRARAVGERAAFTLPVWSVPILYAPAPRPPGRRNVILVSLDTLRADHLTLYGYERATSPFLARKFGEEGLVFDHLVAAATLTGPSHMTLFTSLPPSVHGDGLGPDHPRADVVTLAEQLRSHGFRTAAFTENAALDASLGHARGFDEWTEDKGGTGGLPKGQIARTFTRGLDWWRRHRDQPFFLFLHTYQVHFPYSPPEGYVELVARETGDGSDHLFARCFRGQEDCEGWGRRVELYDAEIRYVDDQMRELLATLEREGLRDTVLVVTSDHGEEFGEHGFRGHGVTLHAEVTHVPLMLLGDGIPAGRRVDDPAAHVDLMPTVLDLAGVPAPDHLMGRSLVGHFDAAAPAGPPAPAPAFSETWLGFGQSWAGERVTVGTPAFAVRLGDRKLVRYRDRDGGRDRYEYFELADDPGEQRNRYEPERPEIAELRRLLDEFPRRAAEARAALDRTSRPEPALDPERERKLRALGYIVD